MKLSDNAQIIKTILTKSKLYPDDLLNNLDTRSLMLMKEASRVLIKKMTLDEMLITTEAVKKIIKDDIEMTKLNMKVIESAIRLREHYCINSFCLN